MNIGIKWLVFRYAIVLINAKIYAMEGIKSRNISTHDSLRLTTLHDVVFLFEGSDIGETSGRRNQRQR